MKMEQNSNIIKISDDVYVFLGKANNVLCIYDINKAVLFDSGYSVNDTYSIINFLKCNKIELVFLINSHHHIDHVQGNKLILDCFPNAVVMGSVHLIYNLKHGKNEQNMYYGGNFPDKVFESLYTIENAEYSIELIPRDEMRLNKLLLKFISFEGHCSGNTGILINNRYLFSSDILFGKNSMPIIHDVQEEINNLKSLLKSNYELIIPSHGSIVNSNQIKGKVQECIDSIKKYEVLLLEFIRYPKTTEQICAYFIKNNFATNCFDSGMNFSQYQYTNYTIKNFLSFLINNNKVKYSICDGYILYKAV